MKKKINENFSNCQLKQYVRGQRKAIHTPWQSHASPWGYPEGKNITTWQDGS